MSQNPNLEIVTTISAEWNRQKAYEAATNIITAHPDIVGLFVQNEDMTVGVASALERLGKLEQVTIVSKRSTLRFGSHRRRKLQYQCQPTVYRLGHGFASALRVVKERLNQVILLGAHSTNKQGEPGCNLPLGCF